MAVRRLFESATGSDFILEVTHSSGIVEITIDYPSFDSGHGGFIALDPDDIPALIAELRRVAKLAKEARHG